MEELLSEGMGSGSSRTTPLGVLAQSWPRLRAPQGVGGLVGLCVLADCRFLPCCSRRGRPDRARTPAQSRFSIGEQARTGRRTRHAWFRKPSHFRKVQPRESRRCGRIGPPIAKNHPARGPASGDRNRTRAMAQAERWQAAQGWGQGPQAPERGGQVKDSDPPHAPSGV